MFWDDVAVWQIVRREVDLCAQAGAADEQA